MLNKELKFDRYENSFLWLKDAGVALPVYNVEAPVIPLKASKSSNVFRLFSNDTGLLTSAYPAETKLELINKNREKSALSNLQVIAGTAPDCLQTGAVSYTHLTLPTKRIV